jgi:hypothetical protein
MWVGSNAIAGGLSEDTTEMQMLSVCRLGKGREKKGVYGVNGDALVVVQFKRVGWTSRGWGMGEGRF